jgi:hypothetical protein
MSEAASGEGQPAAVQVSTQQAQHNTGLLLSNREESTTLVSSEPEDQLLPHSSAQLVSEHQEGVLEDESLKQEQLRQADSFAVGVESQQGDGEDLRFSQETDVWRHGDDSQHCQHLQGHEEQAGREKQAGQETFLPESHVSAGHLQEQGGQHEEAQSGSAGKAAASAGHEQEEEEGCDGTLKQAGSGQLGDTSVPTLCPRYPVAGQRQVFDYFLVLDLEATCNKVREQQQQDQMVCEEPKLSRLSYHELTRGARSLPVIRPSSVSGWLCSAAAHASASDMACRHLRCSIRASCLPEGFSTMSWLYCNLDNIPHKLTDVQPLCSHLQPF